MKKNKFVTLCSMCLMFATYASAQTTTRGIMKYEGESNFAELAQYYKEHPSKNIPKLPPEEDEDLINKTVRPAADPTRVFLFDANKTAGAPELPVSPSPMDSFQSTLTNGANIPPDTHGAVGNGNYVVTADNYQIKLQNRTGGVISALTLDNWWGLSGTYDPRVHYDPYKNVWIMVVDYGGASSTPSKIYVAISTTSNPGGTWKKYSISIDPTLTYWLDFPSVGFNNQWVVISGNVFTNSTPYTGNGVWVYVIDYAAMIAGTGGGAAPTFTKIIQGSSFSICPALTYSATEPNMYLMEIYNDNVGQLQLWEITGTTSTASMNPVGWPSTTTAWLNSSYANNSFTSSTPPGSDFAPQTASTHKLQTNDDRINNLVFRNGTLWTSHTVFLPFSSTANPTRSSVMWWQIDTNGIVLQNKLIDDPTSVNFYAFPSIAVNANNDALIGFSCMSATTHPSATYAYHSHNDGLSTVRPNFVYRHGQAAYYLTFGGGKNRWGDYSATCVDPSNDMDFWTNQESVAPSPANTWDTWWAQVKAPPVGITETVVTEAKFNIVPNPNNGNFDIDFGKPTGMPFHVSIADVRGKIVYNKEFDANQGSKVSISTHSLTSGIYLASVVLDGVVTSKKIEISK